MTIKKMEKMLLKRYWILAALAVFAGLAAWMLAAILPGRGKLAEEGVQKLTAYGCGSCHSISGVAEAYGVVGPPLDFWASRWYIAGSLLNTPDNFIIWVTNPQEIEPGTAMPAMGVSEQDAHHIAAYLYSLEAREAGDAGVRGFGSNDSLPPLPSGGGRLFGY